MIKKLTDEEIKNMSVEEIETEFKNIYKEKEFGGAAKPEINLPLLEAYHCHLVLKEPPNF